MLKFTKEIFKILIINCIMAAILSPLFIYGFSIDQTTKPPITSTETSGTVARR